jgi:7-cyano-7-deazaguanine synthase in queuosine biosynthesis
MCTLGGFVAGKDGKVDSRIFNQILKNMDLRGRDAFGVVLKSSGLETIKFVCDNVKDLIANFNQPMDLGTLEFVSMTGRAIPAAERVMGTINVKRDTQPFVYKDFIVSHNGLLSNDDILRSSFNITTESPVDTAIIPRLIDFFKDNYYSNTTMHVINNVIKGSYALSVIDTDKDKITLATNFMPLYYQFHHNVLYWASDPKQLPNGKQLDYYSALEWYWNSLSIDGYSVHSNYSLHNKLDSNKVLVICSGGLDSVTTLKLYKTLGLNVTMVHFRYGQAAEEAEEWSTAKIAKIVGVERIVLDVKDLFGHTIPSVLLGNKTIEHDRQLDMESTLSYVGCRNLLFTSITMGLAEKLGAGKISLGLNLDDSVFGSTQFLIRHEDKIVRKTIAEIESENLTNLSVLSMNRENYKLEEKKITKVWKHSVKKKAFEIRTKNNVVLKISESHGIFKLNCSSFKIESVCGKNIVVGDYLIMSKNQLVNSSDTYFKDQLVEVRSKSVVYSVPLTSTVLEFLGLWIADGCYDSHSVKISCNKKEFDTEWWDRLIKDLQIRSYTTQEINNSIDGTINSVKLKRWMEQSGFEGYSHTKIVPEWIYNLTSKQISSFLRGYFSGDGCVCSRSKTIQASSVSSGLIQGIRSLLLQLGIFSTIYDGIEGGPGYIFNKIYQLKKSYELVIRGIDNIKNFKNIGFLQVEKNNKVLKTSNLIIQDHFHKIPVAKEVLKKVRSQKGLFSKLPYLANLYEQVGINRNHLRTISKLINNKNLEILADSEVYFVPVISVKEIPMEEYVYDFSVEDNENFFDANGILYHNSVYSDNNITFLREFTKLSACSMDVGARVEVTAPFVNLTKKEILEIAFAIGSPLEYQVSCYYPQLINGKIMGCGDCGCDKLREYSFKALGIKDPVEYLKPIDWGTCRSIEEVYPDYQKHLNSSTLPPSIPYYKYLNL